MTNPKFEDMVRADLHQYLLTCNEIDERLPEAFDIEELWPKIGESYITDGVREFQDYPTVSLGWTMYIGMALAKMWDELLDQMTADACGVKVVAGPAEGTALGNVMVQAGIKRSDLYKSVDVKIFNPKN